jgi:hypothetical protein
MVTANTTMMAALSDPITASGTNSLWYRITSPGFSSVFAGEHWRHGLVRWNHQKVFSARRGTGVLRCRGIGAARNQPDSRRR